MKKFTLFLSVLLLSVAQAALPCAAKPQIKPISTQAKPMTYPLNLAIMLFEGVQIIDYTGPYETFGHAYDHGQMFNIYTVSEKGETLTTAMGMTVTPKYSFANCPKPDVIVFPGGDVDPSLANPTVMKWVKTQSAEAKYVMSVCNGAFFLAEAGLLDGQKATTFYGMIDDLQKVAPKCLVVSDQRFVDNGKFMTTAGLSSGIDGALHLIEKIAGYGVAQQTALSMEYNWLPNSGYARASFADRHLRKVLGQQGFAIPDTMLWKVMEQKGDATWWTKKWKVGMGSASDLLKIIDTKLAEGWTKIDSKGSAERATSTWKFTDEKGSAWNASATAEPVQGESNTLVLTISLTGPGASKS